MSAIKKLVAILLAITVVASSAAIFAGVEPALNLLASIEKEYENHLFQTETNLLDVAETPRQGITNALNGQASK
ncbi:MULTISPECIES: hypothetical protein, partial [Bacteria]|uniref:hypothetical protein n=1 Tax=Bacteria TaxID=2 RepID=UPI001CCB4168